MRSKQIVQNIISVNSITEFNHKLNETFEENTSYKIKLDDPINPEYLLKNIDFSPLFYSCQYLDLKIKGRHTDQNDFDHFFNQLGKFSALKSLKFRFYNKRLKYLDNLLISVRKINEVTLDFKNFRKIELLQDYKNINFQTENLDLNLKNAVIKENSIQKFVDYIGAHSYLKQFHISMDKKCTVQLLEQLTKNTQINIEFPKSNISKKSMDLLISIVKNNHLKVNMNEDELCTMMKIHLGNSGIIKFDRDFLSNRLKDNYCSISYFNEEDFKLQEQLPFLTDLLIERSEYMKRYIKICTNSLSLCFKYLINKINKYYDRIEFYTGYQNNYGYYNNYGKSKSTNHIFSQKILKYNKYSWQIEITEDKDTKYLKMFNSIVNLRLKFNNHIHEILKRFIFHFLKQQQYLIYLNDPQYIKNENLYNLVTLVKQRGTNFLRFLAFKKFISPLVPLSNQIFYDLLTND